MSIFVGKSNKITVRFDDRTWMILEEIAEVTGLKVYGVVRGLVARAVNQLIDERGNLIIDEAEKDKEADQP